MTGTNERVIRRVEEAVAAALHGPCRALASGPAGDCLVPMLVAVSGGPDSLALLHALTRVTSAFLPPGDAPSPVHVAYLDHGLRPQSETAAEREFVAAQAAALALPFVSGRVDVHGVARREHRSIEDAARRCRYRFLAEAARARGIGLVAAGHTATDQAETVLLRVIRGTGVAGLAAMDWRSPWPVGDGPDLVRPMLGLRREETEAYCRALGLIPRRDPENDSPRYRRNRVRREVLPLLEQLNPRVVEALAGLADSARQLRDLVEADLDACWPALVRVDAGGVTLARASAVDLPPALRAAALRRAITLAGKDQPPERVHLDAVEGLLTGASGRAVDLPGGVRAEAYGGDLRLSRTDAPDGASLTGCAWPLLMAGAIAIPGWEIEAVPVAAARIVPDPYVAWLNASVFDQPVAVTGRRAGDRIRPLGMHGEKKVQDLLVDACIPRRLRDAVPVVRAGGQVAWVVGVRLAGWAAAAGGEPAVRVVFRPAGRRDPVPPDA